MYNKCYCSDFTISSNLLHPPAVQTARGGEKRVRTLSQREGGQLPVDALNVRRSRQPRLSALARGRYDRRRDRAGSTAATAGHRRALAGKAWSQQLSVGGEDGAGVLSRRRVLSRASSSLLDDGVAGGRES